MRRWLTMRRLGGAFLVNVLVLSGLAAGYTQYRCASMGTIASSCCCPQGAAEDSDAARFEANCCDAERVEVERTPPASGERSEALGAPVVIASQAAAPPVVVARVVTHEVEEVRRGPPVLLAKQSLLI